MLKTVIDFIKIRFYFVIIILRHSNWIKVFKKSYWFQTVYKTVYCSLLQKFKLCDLNMSRDIKRAYVLYIALCAVALQSCKAIGIVNTLNSF